MRQQFEDTISKSPYEYNLERYPDDPYAHAWPGQYKDPVVQMAWELYVDGWNSAVQKAAQECEGRAYSTKHSQFLGPELNLLNASIAINKMTITP